jgi:hypothetical protein
METHPECQEYEKFIGNMNIWDFKRFYGSFPIGKRLGKIAYDKEGKVIPAINELYPLFFKKEKNV